MFQNNLLILSVHRTCGRVSLYADACNLPFSFLVGSQQGSSQRLIVRETRLYCLVFTLLPSVLSSLLGCSCFHWHTLRHVVVAGLSPPPRREAHGNHVKGQGRPAVLVPRAAEAERGGGPKGHRSGPVLLSPSRCQHSLAIPHIFEGPA